MTGGSSSSGNSVAHRAAPARASATNVSSTCHDGVLELHGQGRSDGHLRQDRRQLRVVAPDPSGTRNSTVPSRFPNARNGPVSHGTLTTGSTWSDRKDPPRWAFTENRKSGGRRRDPGCHLRSRRRGVVGVVQLDRGQSPGIVTEASVGPQSGGVEPEATSPDRQNRSCRRTAARAAVAQVRRRTPRGASVSGSSTSTPLAAEPISDEADRPDPRATAVIDRSRLPRSAGSTTSRKCSLMPRRWVRDAARIRVRPRLGQDRLRATRVGRGRSPRSTSPSFTSRSISRVTPLLLEDHLVGEQAHPDAPPGRSGDREERVVLGQRQVVLGSQLLVEPPRDPGMGDEEGTPRGEARVVVRSAVERPARKWTWSGC